VPKKTTPRYAINYGWSLGEGPWNTDMDSNLKALDTLIGTTIISDALATPPASPAAGDTYIVAASGTGAWAGKDGQVAAYIDSAWKFIVPKRGLRAEVQSASGFKYFNGTVWAAEPGGGGGATTLSGLSDVSVTEGAPIDQYNLVWNNATSRWIAKAPSAGGSTTLAGLTDVNVTEGAPIDQYSLVWNNATSKWIAKIITGVSALSGLSDVNVTEGAGIDQYSLVWDNATSKWIPKNVASSGGSTTLSALTDVNVTEGAGIDQNALIWNNATSKWIAKSISQSPAAVFAQNGSHQSIPVGAWTTLTGWTTVKDTSSGAWNGANGTFTAASAGWFSVSCDYTLTSTAWGAGQEAGAAVYVNSTQEVVSLMPTQAASTFSLSPGVLAAAVYLNAGDIITVRAYVSAGPQTLDSTAVFNFISVAQITSPGLAAQPVDLISFYPGAPTASAKCMSAVTPQATTLPISLTGSYAKAGTAATASTTFGITKNGASIGSINFAAGATTGTFTFSAAVTTAAGDVLQIVAPATPDATLADVNFALVGTR